MRARSLTVMTKATFTKIDKYLRCQERNSLMTRLLAEKAHVAFSGTSRTHRNEGPARRAWLG